MKKTSRIVGSRVRIPHGTAAHVSALPISQNTDREACVRKREVFCERNPEGKKASACLRSEYRLRGPSNREAAQPFVLLVLFCEATDERRRKTVKEQTIILRGHAAGVGPLHSRRALPWLPAPSAAWAERKRGCRVLRWRSPSWTSDPADGVLSGGKVDGHDLRRHGCRPAGEGGLHRGQRPAEETEERQGVLRLLGLPTFRGNKSVNSPDGSRLSSIGRRCSTAATARTTPAPS